MVDLFGDDAFILLVEREYVHVQKGVVSAPCQEVGFDFDLKLVF